MNLITYLKSLGYKTIDSTCTDLISRWNEWYNGKVDSFHDYLIWNGSKEVRQSRARLNMAKQGAERWADLLWNNECFITLDEGQQLTNDKGERKAGAAEQRLIEELKRNDFTIQTNILIEKAFALGTGAYVVYPVENGSKAKIDYISAQFIYPLAWYNNDCLSCAFAGISQQDGQTILSLMIHDYQNNGTWAIENKYFLLNGGELKPIPPPENVISSYTSTTKRFELLRPGIVNNTFSNPMGISIFGNYEDVLKCIDLAFDGLKVSMQIGRPRIAVGEHATKPSPSGPIPVFDSNDTVFYQLPGSMNPEAQALIQDITTAYRATDFETSLEKLLALYSNCLGLGEKAFKWENGSVTTATQVISENNGLQRAMEKHQESLRAAIMVVIKAVLDILGLSPDIEAAINFDDSAVRNRDAERMRFWQYVTAGKFPFSRFLVEFEGYSQDEAQKLEAEATKSSISDLERI